MDGVPSTGAATNLEGIRLASLRGRAGRRGGRPPARSTCSPGSPPEQPRGRTRHSASAEGAALRLVGTPSRGATAPGVELDRRVELLVRGRTGPRLARVSCSRCSAWRAHQPDGRETARHWSAAPAVGKHEHTFQFDAQRRDRPPAAAMSLPGSRSETVPELRDAGGSSSGIARASCVPLSNRTSSAAGLRPANGWRCSSSASSRGSQP